jgi:hypothetical protein
MSFLDHFKPNPKWKHADPTVRAAAVAELIIDDPEQHRALIELAGTDEDVRVRRAAVGRVDTVTDLVQLAAAERDEQLRRELTDRLVAVATAPADSDGDAALALGGLTDQKQLSSVAKSSPHDTVRTARRRACMTSARSAASRATRSTHRRQRSRPSPACPIRRSSQHRPQDRTQGRRPCSARATTDGASTDVRSTLEIAASRAKEQVVAKRANDGQSIDEAAAAERAALEQWRQRVASVLARVEALAPRP